MLWVKNLLIVGKNHILKLWNISILFLLGMGVSFLIKSLDRPSANAGISTVHLFGDEIKYLKNG